MSFKKKLASSLILITALIPISCKKKKVDPLPTKPIPTVPIVPPIPTVETKIIDCDSVPSVLEDLKDGVDYIVKCQILIKDRVVTIKPGVVIQFEGKNAGITIGDEYSYPIGALKMVGTPIKPIILQGKSSTPGSWKGIILGGISSENQWEYVTVKDAGGGEKPAGLLLRNMYNYKLEVSIKNCNFINNLGYGISDYSTSSSSSLFGIFRSFENNKFSNNTKSALCLDIANIVGLDEASDYQNNGQNYLEVTGIRGPKYEVTIKKINIPYLIQGNFELINKLIIEPGVVLQFAKDAGFYAMDYNTNGTIIANGTVSLPIKFQGFEPNIKGYWYGIELNNADPNTLFNYCIIDGAGSLPSASGCSSGDKSALHFGARCGIETGRGIITNSTISNSGGHAITYRLGRNVTLSNNTYTGNKSVDIYNH